MSTRRNPMAGILSGPIDAPPEDRLAKVYPKVEAVAGMALSHRASGFSGVLVRLEGGGVEIHRRAGSNGSSAWPRGRSPSTGGPSPWCGRRPR